MSEAEAWAEELATSLLPPLGRRWRHVQGVARRAREVTTDLDGGRRSTVVAAAWLHDIGYVPSIGLLRFHPLDGARFLTREGFPVEVVRLVAYHSGAMTEAEERGLAEELGAFPPPDPLLLSRLSAADMTTSPDGELVSARRRIEEILQRYEPGEPVHRAVSRSGPDLIANAEAVERELALRGDQPT